MANPYGPYSTSNMLGANFEQTSTTPLFAVGQSALGTDNSTWVYVQADVIAAANAVVGVDANFNLIAGTGYTTAAAFAVDDYGWVRKTASPL